MSFCVDDIVGWQYNTEMYNEEACASFLNTIQKCRMRKHIQSVLRMNTHRRGEGVRVKAAFYLAPRLSSKNYLHCAGVRPQFVVWNDVTYKHFCMNNKYATIGGGFRIWLSCGTKHI